MLHSVSNENVELLLTPGPYMEHAITYLITDSPDWASSLAKQLECKQVITLPVREGIPSPGPGEFETTFEIYSRERSRIKADGQKVIDMAKTSLPALIVTEVSKDMAIELRDNQVRQRRGGFVKEVVLPVTHMDRGSLNSYVMFMNDLMLLCVAGQGFVMRQKSYLPPTHCDELLRSYEQHYAAHQS